MTSRFTRFGKAVLTGERELFADAVDEAAAEVIVAALNRPPKLSIKSAAKPVQDSGRVRFNG